MICLIAFDVAHGICAQQWYPVKWVADGDTLFLKDGRRIRLIGINAPEVAHGDRPAEPFGNTARDTLRKIIRRKEVRLEWDQVRRDHYGRYLAHVFDQNGRLLSEEMVGRGLAYVLFQKDNQGYFERLLAAQRNAMAAKQGFWKKIQRHRNHKQFLGNKRSLRFHDFSCPEVKKISFRNRIKFTDVWRAFEQGYAPAKKCLRDIKVLMEKK